MNNSIKKGVVVSVILLFVSVSVIPSTGNRLFFDDITPPVTTCTLDPPEPNGNNSWYVSDVEVTLNATDDMSGVNRTEYRINNGSIKTYTEPFNVSQDGELMIEYRSIDYAGNIEDWKSVEFKIDQTPPNVWLWCYSPDNVHIDFTATCDDTTSGIDRVEFYLDDILQFTDNNEPYEWSMVWYLPYMAIGLILNPDITDDYVKFYALIVIISEISLSICAYAYDKAGNWGFDILDQPLPPNSISGLYLFQNLTLPNDYEGYIGRFLISATFKGV